ncbi:unnamed protein product [Ectocarpus sp. CCAP 1310/34]|nr:unnamed protein product [Ectocarpus sp. CCAP 1310/34]
MRHYCAYLLRRFDGRPHAAFGEEWDVGVPRRSCPSTPKRGNDRLVDEGREWFGPCTRGIRLVISQDDMESVSSLFGQISALRRGGLSPKDDAKKLDAHVRVVMRMMKERLASLTEGPLQDAEVVMAKYGLYSICFQELISITRGTNPDLSCALGSLRDAHDSLLQDVPGIVQRTLDENQQGVSSTCVTRSLQEISSLRDSKEREAREAEELVQRFNGVYHKLWLPPEDENAALKTTHDAGHSSLQSRPRTPLHKPIPDGFTCSTTTTTREKHHALPSASTTRYQGGEGGGRGITPEDGVTPDPFLEHGRTVGFRWDQGGDGEATDGKAASTLAEAVAINGTRELSLKQLHDFIASVYASKEKYDLRCTAQRLPSQTLARHLDDFLVHRYGLTSMARAQAAALRLGVQRYRDADNTVKVFEMTLRNEVDEGFRVEQRKLERTILDLLRVRIRERTERHDNIHNYHDRYSYRRLGGTSISKVAAGNSGSGPSSSGNHRQGGGGAHSYSGAGAASTVTTESLLRSQTRPGALLAAADWQAVVQHVHKAADAQTVIFLIKEAISTRGSRRDGVNGKSNSGKGGSAAGMGQEAVPFGVFLQVLLGYQLHGYLRRLKFFREEFREVDVNADGVLNPAQFLALAKRMLRRTQRMTTPSRQETAQRHSTNCSPTTPGTNGRHRQAGSAPKANLSCAEKIAATQLRAADPHGFGVITFSQCVLHLASSVG